MREGRTPGERYIGIRKKGRERGIDRDTAIEKIVRKRDTERDRHLTCPSYSAKLRFNMSSTLKSFPFITLKIMLYVGLNRDERSSDFPCSKK